MSYRTDKPLVAFLYLLMRDHLNFGAIERIMEDHLVRGLKHGAEFHLSEEDVGRYAERLADQLSPSSLPLKISTRKCADRQSSYKDVLVIEIDGQVVELEWVNGSPWISYTQTASCGAVRHGSLIPEEEEE